MKEFRKLFLGRGVEGLTDFLKRLDQMPNTAKAISQIVW